MRSLKRILFFIWCSYFVFGLSGCSTASVVVQPWEKGYLAKSEMTFDSDSMDNAFVEHTYSSKEASSGGAGVGGGGCGCN